MMFASIIQIFMFDDDDGESNQQHEPNLIFIRMNGGFQCLLKMNAMNEMNVCINLAKT